MPKLDQGQFHQNVFTSMATFCGLLSRTFLGATVSKEQIRKVIDQMTFNESVCRFILCLAIVSF